ncbi:AAA family ATPase [Aerosakkonemataceae cyanobacterium BLCC-F50]|uniref:AAA family ATPase n=1 Tax=Floridaenema flaviceps BLCC-F50 TaxID=3153642 RepID=A0ABV4XSX8_9CYAN
MISLADISVKEKIYESSNSLIYRGIKNQNNLPVILKVLKQDYPTAIELTRYKQEYEITRSLNITGVIQAYSLLNHQRTLAIILEDFGGESLEHWIKELPEKYSPMTLREFLHLAIQITEIIGKIHAANVVHKDINPSNIVMNIETGVIKIIDFGISTRFSYTSPAFQNPNILEGTLAYLSPEQTGRMNRFLDYRTDFYSLGVTFYTLLTGKLPFTTKDVLELVHCHIAKQPVSPHLINSRIPPVVANIVMKLIAKSAEDRYQSAWGIKADLETCFYELEKLGEIPEFQLGTHDISDKFQIPQKLYGRETEVVALIAAFEEINDRLEINRRDNRNQSKLMLIRGYSGIGKSALAQEIYKPITQKKGYYISGKFEQFQRNIPYSALVHAFQSFVRQLLTETEEQLQQWKDNLLTTLGVNGQLVIDVIPEIELIIGKQLPVVEVGLTESQNRFNLVWQNFIRVICSSDRPLVIFLDDLQWVDSASLKLIELIITDGDMRSLFIIGAYRDNEVNSTHALMMMLETLKNEHGIVANQINLKPLELSAIAQLIADTLHANLDSITTLAELVLQKTGGNPFFVNEFLKTLYAEQLITFDTEHICWQWDINQINAKEITENVVELMIDKLKKLPESTQKILQLAACIGSDFDLNTLSIVCENSPTEIYYDLIAAVQFGLIVPISELDENLLIQDYKFLHDRVQQAAYSLIDDEQKQVLNLQIGRNLLEKIPSEKLSEKLFEIVDHFNLGCELVSEQSERENIAKLNLMAGRKAKAAIAFSAAFNYLTTGIKLLSNNCWQSQYNLALALHEEVAEVAYLCSEFEQTKQLVDVVLQQANSTLDTIKAYEIKLKTLIAQFKQLETLKLGLEVLEKLGINLPESPNQLDIEQALSRTKTLLNNRSFEALLDLPIMTDVRSLACIRILTSILPAAYGAMPNLMILIVCEQVNLSIQYGNAPLSAYAYINYGSILNKLFYDIGGLCQLGTVALSLIENFDSKEIKGKTLFAVSLFGVYGKYHLKKSLLLLQEAYANCIEAGELEYAAYAAYIYGVYAYPSGRELKQLEREIAAYTNAIARLNQVTVLQSSQIVWQVVLNLIEEVENPDDLKGKALNEDEYLKVMNSPNNRSGFYGLYLHKLILSYLFGDYAKAFKFSPQVEQNLNSATGSFIVELFYFYDSLVRLAVYSSVPQSEQEQLLNKVATYEEILQKWVNHAPMNFQHKVDLIAAEKARVLGQILEAENYYERAIKGAKNHDYIQEEALAYELAAKFYLARGMEKFAQTYLREAHYCYERWGAIAKVKALETQYPEFFSQNTVTTVKTLTTTTSSSKPGTVLDLAAVIKASQAISSEIVLDRLLTSLMKILIENAGAQTGFLILDNDGKWVIEALCEVSNLDTTKVSKIEVLKSVTIDNHLPASIINYVVRTKESVVLNDASHDATFADDPYIKTHKSKSILCTPLINQGQLTGIVYLENSLTTGAFTANRLEVIQLLSGQAAIAITNAKLYAEVQARENQLSQFVNAIPVGVTVVNPKREICYVNQKTYELCGIDSIPENISQEILKQVRVYQAGTDQIYPAEQLPIVRSLAGETITTNDVEFRLPDRTVSLEVTSTPIFDEAGKIIYAIAAFQDITQRKQAENILADYNRVLEQQVTERTFRLREVSDQLLAQNTQLANEIEERKRVEAALLQKEAINRAIISTIPDLLIWMDREGNYLGFFNHGDFKVYNPEHERVGANIYDVLPPEVAQERMEYVQIALETGELLVFENQITVDGVVHYQETRIAANGDNEVLIIVRDFDARKQAEQASILEERNRMAREIHDTLAQAFTGIIVHLEAAAIKTIEDPTTAQQCIQTGSELARFGLSEARRSVQALRPQMLADGDLYSAINRIATQLFSYTRTQITCELIGEKFPLPIEVENNFLRIGQEALTNAAKYAKATEIQINLVYEQTQCILRIKDNGQGFKIKNLSVGGGFGLLGMTERAERIGAHLSIQSAIGEGTEIVVSINQE